MSNSSEVLVCCYIHLPYSRTVDCSSLMYIFNRYKLLEELLVFLLCDFEPLSSHISPSSLQIISMFTIRSAAPGRCSATGDRTRHRQAAQPHQDKPYTSLNPTLGRAATSTPLILARVAWSNKHRIRTQRRAEAHKAAQNNPAAPCVAARQIGGNCGCSHCTRNLRTQ